MHRALLALADTLHRLTAGLCAALLLFLLAAEILVVLLRYVFGIGFLELQGAVNYSFAILVVLALPVALRLDKHVRVDVFRRVQSERTARRIDMIGILALLIPVFALTAHFVAPDIVYSWSILEGSIETGGLPGYFLVKTALPVSCLLMMIQGIARMLSPVDES